MKPNDACVRASALAGLGAAALSAVLTALLFGFPLKPAFPVPLFWGCVFLALGSVVLFACTRVRVGWEKMDATPAAAMAVLVAMVLIIQAEGQVSLTKWFFQHWEGRYLMFLGVELISSRVLLLALALLPLFFAKGIPGWLWALGLYGFGLSECLDALGDATEWAPIWRDDHPSFIHRLWVLGKILPSFSHYMHYWNGGIDASFLAATGAVSSGVLAWPLLQLMDLPSAYTPLLAFLVIGVVPLAVCWGIRLTGAGWTAGLLGAALALAPSREYLRWLLHFGTLGSATSVPFVVMAAACVYAMVWNRDPRVRLFFVLPFSALMVMSWPLGVVAGVGMVLAVVSSAERFKYGILLRVLIGGGLAVAASLPFLIILLRSQTVKKLAGMTQIMEGEDGPVAVDLLHEWVQACMDLMMANPLILLMGVAGILFARRPGFSRFWGVLFFTVMLVAAFGSVIKPGLEFHRLHSTLCFLLLCPAAILGAELLESRTRWSAPFRALLVALVGFALVNASRTWQNKDIEAQFLTMGDDVRVLADRIYQEVPEGGRLLFAGETVHGFGGGHVVFLPMMTGREMMACDFYHFSPKIVSYDYPPQPFRETPESLFGFLDLYNVTHVITHHRRWARYFRNQPDLYEEVDPVPGKSPKYLFRVMRESNMFLEGEGSVKASLNRIEVILNDPNKDAVLRYNFSPWLEVEPPAALFPVPQTNDILLLGIRPNGSSSITIRYGRAY